MAENREILHQILTEYFSKDEIKSLCFFLNLDYDDLEGEGKAGKARELISYMQRRGRIDELVAKVKRERPDAAEVIELEDQFIARIRPIKQKEKELARQKLLERNRFWDEFQRYMEGLEGEALYRAQKLNNLWYLRSFGLTVEDLKKNLARLGYYRGTIDAEHPPELVTGITEFQVMNNMRHIDGIFGELTYQAMVERLKEKN